MNADRMVELQNVTNEILIDIRNDRLAEVPFHRGGVNWSDLRCVDVEFFTNLGGESGYRVRVEEVAPDEYELQSAIHDRLNKRGFAHVEVITEW